MLRPSGAGEIPMPETENRESLDTVNNSLETANNSLVHINNNTSLVLKSKRLLQITPKSIKICRIGCRLLQGFIVSTAVAIALIVPGYMGLYQSLGSFSESPWLWSGISLFVIFIETILFWIGIILVYLTAQQLRIKYRLVGVLCGLIPIVNIVLLFYILSIARKEIVFESQKLQINEERKDKQICKTKYPILLVHGVFFRDSKLLNYWGRIPDELIKNGAKIYYGNQDSSSSVMDSAKTLAMHIKGIVESTGCEKVNIIAHSKGGLDSRAVIATSDAAKYVASLTTVSTPHRGCEFADWLFTKISEKQRNALAKVYNTIAQKAGDKNPDFLAAVSDLTASSCKKFNEQVHDAPNVYYQSVGSVMKHRVGGTFPLNLTYAFVKLFDGPNDGLVGSNSIKWGENFQLLTIEGNRGISHSDMIDLNRENIPGFDVREFYVNLVSDLKTRGF